MLELVQTYVMLALVLCLLQGEITQHKLHAPEFKFADLLTDDFSETCKQVVRNFEHKYRDAII